MNLLQAFKRLSYTVGNGNKCNDKDVDALNSVIEWVNNEKAKRIDENKAFGKIVIAYYIELLHHYKWDNYTAEKAIQEILERPAAEWAFRFKQNMNTKSWIDAAGAVGLIDDLDAVIDGKGYSYDQKKEIAEKNKQAMRDNKDLLIKSIDPWTDKEINDKLNFFISELLNKYSNMP